MGRAGELERHTERIPAGVGPVVAEDHRHRPGGCVTLHGCSGRSADVSREAPKNRKSLSSTVVLAAVLLLGACTEGNGKPFDTASEAAGSTGAATVDATVDETVDETVVREALAGLLAGPVAVTFAVETTEAGVADLDDETLRNLSFVREDMRILVDAAGNWEAATMPGDGTIRSVDGTTYFAEEGRPSDDAFWEQENSEADGLDNGTYLRIIHELAVGSVGIGSPLGASGPDGETSWWEYCASKGTLSGGGDTWTLTCPGVPGLDDIKLDALNNVFAMTVESVLRDAVDKAAAEGRSVDPEFVTRAVDERIEAETSGLSYEPATNTLTMLLDGGNATCTGVVVFDPTGANPPGIREQASVSDTPCGRKNTENLRIGVVIAGRTVVSLTTGDYFGEGSTATVSYDRDLPAEFAVQAPANFVEHAVTGLRAFAEQVVRNAVAIAVATTWDTDSGSGVDVMLEHIDAAVLEAELDGVAIEKTGSSVIVRALDGPDAGCSVTISPARVSQDVDDAYAMIGPLDC